MECAASPPRFPAATATPPTMTNHPDHNTLVRDENGTLWFHGNGERTVVRPRLCFPWSTEDRFISVRNAKDEEILFVESLDDLDADSRAALKTAMTEARFVMEITFIRAIRTDFELRVWEVETAQGFRAFQTKLDDWPRALPGGGYLVRDVCGDLFLIPDPDALDPKSRERLSAFVD
jgi:hypothetical protein